MLCQTININGIAIVGDKCQNIYAYGICVYMYVCFCVCLCMYKCVCVYIMHNHMCWKGQQAGTTQMPL